MPSYSETLDYIFNLRGGEIDLKLHRVERTLALFDHPERRYPSFHIAGTNGKGSTAAMLHRILTRAGYRAGLYISPHVVSFTERMRVGDEEISEDQVVELAETIKRRTAEERIRLTFFEIVTVMALIFFARREIDAAVVEVGLGGRLDATNLVVPRVSVITTISKDHEAYLGSDLLSIAGEKGGIIKPGVPLVGGAFDPKVGKLFEEITAAGGSQSYFLARDFSVSLKENGLFDYAGRTWNLTNLSVGLAGRHQRTNAALALCALEVAQADFPVTEAAVREGLQTVVWPGRLEVILKRPTVILDGAHNGEGIRTLTGEMRDRLGAKKAKIVFAAMADKDWPLMLRELSTIASEIILTRVAMERSADPAKMAAAVHGIPVTVAEDSRQAVRRLLEAADPDDVIVVAGSLYLLGEVRPLLLQAAASGAPDAGPASHSSSRANPR
ncbi:MAG TPA: folylpolyglutamate synthase/dihydrofolate synthase family protein [Candidatus Binatia bacterium]|jgi:dihydrofolate synthase/folylpolyglutamate synthase